MSPTRGITSRTARVSVARRNLKEAAGKTLARRTGSGYEASMRDEKANAFKVQYLYGTHDRISDGHKRERKRALPGEVCRPASVLAVPRGAAMGRQKSAEGIRGRSTRPKART